MATYYDCVALALVCPTVVYVAEPVCRTLLSVVIVWCDRRRRDRGERFAATLANARRRQEGGETWAR